MGLFRNNRTA